MAFRPTRTTLSQSSSRAWLARQARDPYVRQRLSHPASYRSRSAFKLLELDEKWGGFLSRTDVTAVVDLGAAPGGWAQVLAGKMGWTEDPQRKQGKDSKLSGGRVYHPKHHGNLNKAGTPDRPQHGDGDGSDDNDHKPVVGKGTIVAVDLLPILPIPGVHTLQIDFLSPQAEVLVKRLLTSDSNPDGRADVILSDMAPNMSGNRIRDNESSLELAQAVFRFAKQNLRTARSIARSKGGVLLLKHFTHPLLQQFRVESLEPNFHDVKFIKPDASRAASSEAYWLCQGWKG